MNDQISIPAGNAKTEELEFISLEDVELDLPKEIIEAREYQFNLV